MPISPRLRARADRVERAWDLGQLLFEYGYGVVPDPSRPQQFSCDLHGVDRKPSARFYPATNSTYCWVCRKSRGVVAWTMEKEALGFRGAVEFLEQRAGLEPLPWEDEEARENRSPSLDLRAFEEARARLDGLLSSITREREGGMENLVSNWELRDRVDYGVLMGEWSPDEGVRLINRIREHVMERLKSCVSV